MEILMLTGAVAVIVRGVRTGCLTAAQIVVALALVLYTLIRVIHVFTQ